jgi:hypothetical protein
MPSSPKSCNSDNTAETQELEIEFLNPQQAQELFELLIEKHNSIQDEIEAYEMIDDDVQELRELTLDKYEHQLLADAYEAAGHKSTATGLRNQAEELDERIEELQANIENIDIREHMIELYELDIRRETLEVQMKACEKYLEKSKRKAYLEIKKQAIRPASPRRYPKAASPSRLNTELGREDKERKIDEHPPSPKATPKKSATLPLPLPLPLPKKK